MLKYSASLPLGISCANSDRLSAWLPAHHDRDSAVTKKN